MRAVILLVIAGACGAVPDEVSVSGFSSRYEFLGAGSLKGDGNDYGGENGVMLTATYKLKPQSIRIVEPIRIVAPPSVAQIKPDEIDIKSIGSEVVGDIAKDVSAKAASVVDDLKSSAVQQVNELIDGAGSEVKESIPDFSIVKEIEELVGDYIEWVDTAILAICILLFFIILRLFRGKKK